MADRLAQVSGHLSNAYGRGLLAGEVALITGVCELCSLNSVPVSPKQVCHKRGEKNTDMSASV